MTDFGANIFGPDEPTVPPRRPPKPPTPPPPPPREHQRAPTADRPTDATRPDPAPRPERPARADADPGDQARGPIDRAPSHGRGPRDDRDDRGPRGPRPPHGDRPHEPRRDHRNDRGPERPRHEHPPRDRDRPAPRPPEPRHEAPRREPPRPSAPPATAVRAEPAGRVAVLVDLAALREEARTLGAELSQHKLRNGIANHRPVARAVGFAPAGIPAPSGFEAVVADAGFVAGVQFAAMAFELVAATGHLVLAPATPGTVELARALRRAGHDVELAGLAAAGPGAEPVRRLGRDCLFVP